MRCRKWWVVQWNVPFLCQKNKKQFFVNKITFYSQEVYYFENWINCMKRVFFNTLCIQFTCLTKATGGLKGGPRRTRPPPGLFLWYSWQVSKCPGHPFPNFLDPPLKATGERASCDLSQYERQGRCLVYILQAYFSALYNQCCNHTWPTWVMFVNEISPGCGFTLRSVFVCGPQQLPLVLPQKTWPAWLDLEKRGKEKLRSAKTERARKGGGNFLSLSRAYRVLACLYSRCPLTFKILVLHRLQRI